MSESDSPLILNECAGPERRAAVRRILEEHRFAVAESAAGVAPAAAIVDSHERCRAWKSAASPVPVLYVAGAAASTAEIATALEAGAENCLVEPIEPEILVAALRSALRGREAVESAHRLASEWQATFDAIRDGLAVADASGTIRRANHALAEYAGEPSKHLLGTPAAALWSALGAGDPPPAGERQITEAQRNGRHVLAIAEPMHDETGALTGTVHIFRDVTERRRLEAQFRESQKFETIGTLAGGVAHDFNNLLTSIMGNASLLLSGMAPDAPGRDSLEDIVKASQRAGHLTRQLLAYSGKARGFQRKVSLSAIVERSRGLIEASVPKKVKLDLGPAPDLPDVEADPNQIQQVLLNLVSNAAEAIGEQPGAISIRTAAAGGRVLLEVQDTGCGMDGETRARIFDPFFTTKFTGRGLGLSALAGIVRSHKGTVEVESTPGQGSTFRIWLDAVAPHEAAVPPAEAPAKPDTAATVLVADDEDMLRRLAHAALEALGYRVVEAANGLEAIRQVKGDPSISVVLLDLMMPVMGGAEAIDEILRERPEIKVIVSTGYDEGETVERFRDKRVAGYLHKPYTAKMLVEKIRRVL